MTRQQAYMKQALAQVREVLGETREVQKAYGALCHQIPMLVLTNGLALTAAYVDAKAAGTGDRAAALRLMQRHLICLLGGGEDETMLAAVVAGDACQTPYMLATFTILDAGAYYMRFAESLLKVESGARDPALEAGPEGE